MHAPSPHVDAMRVPDRPVKRMRAIELFHLRRVRDKPRALALITAHAAVSADEALAVLHAAIGGGRPRMALPGDDAARALITALAAVGFVGRFAAAQDFDAPESAQAALSTVQGGLPSAIADAVGANLLAGDWASALDHALQHLRMHRAVDDADRRRLERAAIDTGLVRGVPGRT
ncbi:MAG: hypothetical protein Q4G70_12010 [Pseudomonadota bacterium]|nr:hypothetical protein [Pseudomonadota bacterium]